NASPVDEFQPNLAVADDGTVSVNFYDRRLACPAAGTAEAAAAGIGLDRAAQNPDYTGPVPPYGAPNYCVNASIQFYTPTLTPVPPAAVAAPRKHRPPPPPHLGPAAHRATYRQPRRRNDVHRRLLRQHHHRDDQRLDLRQHLQRRPESRPLPAAGSRQARDPLA